MSMIDYTFGLISEGQTDQIILKHILFGWMRNKTMLINPLQPVENESGGWAKVFKYCESKDFKAALRNNDFIVIQIDTDFMSGDSVGDKYRINLKDKSTEETVHAFREKLIELIRPDFYDECADRIIFAIAVNGIECWLLPIYFPNKKTTATKTTNCIDTLNTVLKQKEGLYINAKEDVYYRKMAKHFRKKKDLLKYAKKQTSFQLFIDNLSSKIS